MLVVLVPLIFSQRMHDSYTKFYKILEIHKHFRWNVVSIHWKKHLGIRFVRILRVLLNGLLIVFLCNYAVNILCIKTGDGYGFYCMLTQPEIDVQSTSNRKLPNFYEKVTDFLWESYRISKWWQNSVLTEAWRDCHNQRVLTYYTNWIFIQIMRLFMHSCRLLMLFNP